MSSSYIFSDHVTSIKGIGDSYAQKLEKLNIKTVGDLVRHFPNRYLDFSRVTLISEIRESNTCSLFVTITEPKSFYTKSRKIITHATAFDETGKISLIWYNNPYIKRMIEPNQKYSVAGKISVYSGKLCIQSPVVELGNSFGLNTKGLVPVYPQTAGITSRWLRQKIFNILGELQFVDPLTTISNQIDLKTNLETAYKNIHFPNDNDIQKSADKRFSYNNHLMVNIQNIADHSKMGKSIKIPIDKITDQETTRKIPFSLTKDQNITIIQIYKDLGKSSYTHRLIQGDTGSGKTITLVYAANQCIKNNLSCAILVPTEILAQQHLETFSKYTNNPQNTVLITRNTKTITNYDLPHIFIGTHSLFNKIPENLKYPLAFVAIDEQHKFGVAQRETLQSRKPLPHFFNLSATPIPRTVALSVLGDISVSNIKSRPLNRLETKTYVMNSKRFSESTIWLNSEISKGNKVFVVCPNISSEIGQTASVEKYYDIYRSKVNSSYPIWKMHGKMKTNEQHETVNSFRKAKNGVLVSTSLIEVGIDVPDANIIIIHSSERFGLAQLHQLRGRVGRGGRQGYCFLVTTSEDESVSERLNLMHKYHTGKQLAKADLKLRGAGEVFGIKQHGLPNTKLRYFWSKKLFLKAKADASTLYNKDPKTALRIASELTTC